MMNNYRGDTACRDKSVLLGIMGTIANAVRERDVLFVPSILRGQGAVCQSPARAARNINIF